MSPRPRIPLWICCFILFSCVAIRSDAATNQLYTIWTSEYVRVGSSQIEIVQLLPDEEHHVYLLCKAQSASGQQETLLAKMDRAGTILWDTNLSSSGSTNSEPVACTLFQEGVFACSNLGLSNNQYGVLSTAFSANGSQEWAYVYSTNIATTASSICVDSMDRPTIAGKTGADGMVLKLSPTGSCEWIRIDDGSFGGDNEWTHVQPGLSGGVYTAGIMHHPGPGTFALLSSITATGGLDWSDNFWNPKPQLTASDSAGNFYIAGEKGDGEALLKYSPAGSNLWEQISATHSPYDYEGILLHLSQNEDSIYIAGNRIESGKYRYQLTKLQSNTGSHDWTEIIQSPISPVHSWQLYAADVGPSGYSLLSGNNGSFLIDQDGTRVLDWGDEFRHLTSSSGRWYTTPNGAIMQWLSPLPPYSDSTFQIHHAHMHVDSNYFTALVPSIPGQEIQVEWTTDLTTTNWNMVTNFPTTYYETDISVFTTNDCGYFRIIADSSP